MVTQPMPSFFASGKAATICRGWKLRPKPQAHQMGSKAFGGRALEVNAFGDHDAAVVTQRSEVVAGVYGQEGLEGIERFAGFQRARLSVLDRNGGAIGRRHGDRFGDEFGLEFIVTNGQPDIGTPHINDGRAAAVIVGIHAKVVLLEEAGL